MVVNKVLGTKPPGRPPITEYLEIHGWAKREWEKYDPPLRANALWKLVKSEFPTDRLRRMEAKVPPWETFRSWARKWKTDLKASAIPHVKSEDREFQWHNMEIIQIPWEASEWIASAIEEEKKAHWVAAVFRQGGTVRYSGEWTPQGLLYVVWSTEDPQLPGYVPITFSGRQVRWWWRIHQLAPYLDSRGSVALGNECYRREAASELTGEPLDLSDVFSWCDYHKPSDKDMLRKSYPGAITQGLIRQLKIRFSPDYENSEQDTRDAVTLSSLSNPPPDRPKDRWEMENALMEARRLFLDQPQ